MRLTVNRKCIALSGNLREMVKRGEKVRGQAGRQHDFLLRGFIGGLHPKMVHCHPLLGGVKTNILKILKIT